MQRKYSELHHKFFRRLANAALIVSTLVLAACVIQDIEATQSSKSNLIDGEFVRDCSVDSSSLGRVIGVENGYKLFRSFDMGSKQYIYSIGSPYSKCVISTKYQLKDGVRIVPFFVDDHGVSLATESVVLGYFEHLREVCASEGENTLMACDSGVLAASAVNGIHIVFKPISQSEGRPRILTVLPHGAFSGGKEL